MQIGSVEPVVLLFPYDPLAWPRRKEQFPSRLKRLIDGIYRAVVLKEDHRCISRPGSGEQIAYRSNESMISWYRFRSRNKGILDIYDDQGIDVINRTIKGNLQR